ncbi:MAG: family 1 glycosylhydrolase, partial [Candidatus Uhrbacteria bacterium]
IVKSYQSVSHKPPVRILLCFLFFCVKVKPFESTGQTSGLPGGVDNYLNFIKKLRANKIEPFVTLWHWPMPIWLKNLGGWESPKMPEYFARFSEFVIKNLNTEVNFWLTLNEPEIYASHSYLKGEWPPQKKSLFAMLRVTKHLIAGHKMVYKIAKQIDSNNQIGVAKHNICFAAKGSNLWNKILKKIADWIWNDYFLYRLKNHQDFIGLNFYFHNEINWWFNRGQHEKYSDLNWALVPEGIYWVLNDLRKYHKPIYITENGLADKDDKHRIWYIEQILKNVSRAISNGIPVKGYSHWSLIDNFEWAMGFAPRFGLFEINRQTFERTPRSAAKYYAEVCQNNQIKIIEE